MPEYISIEDLPPATNKGRRWPWAEWQKIPEGHAIEVTDLHDIKLSYAISSLRLTNKKHPEWGLTIMARKDKVYIAKERKTNA